MRKFKKGGKFHRTKGKRKALFKGLINNLIMTEGIETTVAKAKEIKPMAERLVTLAKKKNVASLRLILSRVPKEAGEKLYYEIAPRYESRTGGYLRVIKTAKARVSDGSDMARLEFVA